MNSSDNREKATSRPLWEVSDFSEAPDAAGFPVFLLAGLCLLLVGLLIFRNFVLNDKTLLYTDMGSDSVNDTYPYFVHLSDYIRTEGFPSWSFYVGMGQSLAYRAGDLILEPIIWLPRELIARALVFQHLLKVLVAGLLFFRFLQLRGLTLCASLLGSLLLSFSAYMCMGSCWIINADEVLCFTFLLLAVEEAICRGRWIYIPFAVALIGLVTVFHLYLAAVLLCLYVPARLIEIYGWRRTILSRVCFQLAGIALLGIGLGAIVFLEGWHTILNSPRGSGAIANFNWGPTPSLFRLESRLYYMTAVLRSFSNDIIGTGDDFRAWGNYFEAPISYCGLLSLLLLPQVFIGARRRQRTLYVLFFTFIVIPVLFPWFRYLFWLFQGGYYRAFSLFSMFGVVMLSMTALSRYGRGRILNLWVLSATLLVLLAVLYLPFNEFQTLINHSVQRTAAVLLILYSALLISGKMVKRQSLIAWVLAIVSAIEIIYFDRLTVNRPTVMKHELNGRLAYNDETVDAVGEIKERDKDFFRITKTRSSGPATYRSFNDAMVFGYYGTSSYSSFNNLNYIKFLIALDVISGADVPRQAQWSDGLRGFRLLSTFACEKYVLTEDPVPFGIAEHYEFVRRYGSIYLFRNKAFLPLGIPFDHYLSEDIFLELPSWVKPQALLHAVVLSEKIAAGEPGLARLSLDELKQQIRETSIPDTLAERRATALSIHFFSQTRIEGRVRLNQKSILVFQTPFDAGWHASMDGRPVPVVKVDAGLLGAVLASGDHAVELYYRSPFRYAGAALTLVSLLILLLTLRWWPRIQLPP